MKTVWYAIFDNGENICPDEDCIPICSSVKGICRHVLDICEEDAAHGYGDVEDYHYLKGLFDKGNFKKLLGEFKERDVYIHETKIYY